MCSNDADALVVNEAELYEYISTNLNLDEDTVTRVLDQEMVFLDALGLVYDEKPENSEREHEYSAFVDADELVKYVASTTGFCRDMVEDILDAEMEFLEMRGIAERM